MGTLVSSNNIARLLKMKGIKRLQVKDEVTECILGFPYDKSTGGIVKLQFLESRNFEGPGGKWNEYNALFRIEKIKESAAYMGAVFEALSHLMKGLCQLENDGFGIQEVECGLADYYYVLIYIIKNDGREDVDREEYEF